uniref:Carbohydrate kinase PfkB domain-containing protein n=1 Tax=Arcella intermedia TaxID=1963864 RepID=A0A6B2LBG8_9EUKA
MVVGMAAIDVIGKSKMKLMMEVSNIGKIAIHPGGVGRNVAECLARLDASNPPYFLSIIGSDHFGHLLQSHLQELGMDSSTLIVHPTHSTAVFQCLLDSNGEMHAAINDMDIIDSLEPLKLRELVVPLLSKLKLIVFDANIPVPCMVELCKIAGDHGIDTFFLPTSVAKCTKILEGGLLSSVKYLSLNRLEAMALLQAINPDTPQRTIEECAQEVLQKGVSHVIITQGPNPLLYRSKELTQYYEPKPTKIVNTTGAGDSLSAGVIYGIVSGWPMEKSIDLGLAAAACSIQSQLTISPQLSLIINK